MSPLLEIRNLDVRFGSEVSGIDVVDGMCLEIVDGEVLALVGESGSGKSMTALAALGLVPQGGRIVDGSIALAGRELIGLSEREYRRIRGREIGMIFQEPSTALNPLLTVGAQIREAIRAHRSVSKSAANDEAVELLRSVHVPDPARRVSDYPHQFSGGMAQRVAIAIAIANQPRLLIADEPTTALDVTVQAQVLETLRDVQIASSAAMLLITHDMGLVAETADRVAVMYAGRVVESGDVATVLDSPQHPYTQGLLRCLPRLDGERRQLVPIPGQPSEHRGRGCAFADRCALSAGRAACREQEPKLLVRRSGSASACHFAGEMNQS